MSDSPDSMNTLSPVKRALSELRAMRAKLDAIERARTEPIAIVGLGCRFPGGAESPEAYWQLLREGTDAITEVPPERWDVEAYYDPEPDSPGKLATRHGGFLSRVDAFDADFFGISPREAVSMDPQQRLLLEVSWEALEHAGQPPAELAGSRTGVFVGIASFDYAQLNATPRDPARLDAYLATGSSHSVAAGRLSYWLGLQGPSLAIDTACSSSLVAVHLACQSLRSGECRLALAGGVNLVLRPEIGVSLSKARMMAADGRCKAFDAAADGFVRSEGCGIVVLKRLSDAVAEGDRVLALIRGSAINQDGRSHGLTAPNGVAQEAVIRDALAGAAVEPAEVSYVETHGTGTALGDPIEVRALGAIVGRGRRADAPVVIGSVKTNIGHAETAAGVAGLIKVVLALEHGELPPHLHFKTPNPHIQWNELPVVVSTERRPWPRGMERRIAGVSSFGFSGTNAHVLVEEAPAPSRRERSAERPLHVLALSTKSDVALTELAALFERRLSTQPTMPVGDVCFTANAGRSHFSHRLAVVAASAPELQAKLAALGGGCEPAGLLRGARQEATSPEVAFLFTGQGSQYAGMGRQLYDTQPTFRRALDRCDEVLRSHLDESLLSILGAPASASSLLDQTAYAQPALFALEYALAELWRSWGVEPTAVAGHSLGEVVAACVAGVFSLEDGLRLVVERGRLMQALPGGGMAAVFAGAERIAAALASHAAVSVAAINGPDQTVISGPSEAVRAAVRALEADGIRCRRLRVSHAFHSSLVEPILDDFERAIAGIVYAAPRIALASTVTGRIVADETAARANYWRRQIREPVRFRAAMDILREQGHRVFLEIGPSPTLISVGRQCFGQELGLWLPSLRHGQEDWSTMLESLAALYVRGVGVDWAGFDRDYARQRISLPTYPWVRQRYWLDLDPSTVPRTVAHREPPAGNSVWQSVVAAGDRQAAQVPLDLALDTYSAKWACLDRVTRACAARTLSELGAYARPAVRHSPATLCDELGILPVYRNLIGRWLEMLAADGLLRRDGEHFSSAQPLPAPTLEQAFGEARAVLADIPFLLSYLERCGALLSRVLTGAESPLETLFPSGESSTAEDIYHRWALARYSNGIARGLIEAIAHSPRPDRDLRVLEIGAGTGGTTASLLPALPPDLTTYWYTDVSEFFFARAQELFGAYPFVRYGVLDIERAPREQGYGAHAFDVVVAANVLHATRDLSQTLDHVRSLLVPGGLLLLYETTSYLAWFDISIALIEGWHRFDDGLRRGHPLLTRSQWEETLRARGFDEVKAFPERGSPTEILAQHVFVARAPSSPISGEVRTRTYVPARAGAAHDGGGPGDLDGRRVPAGTPRAASAYPAKPDESAAFLEELRAATPADSRDRLVDYVRGHLMRVLRRESSQPVSRHARLMDVGVDSLMAVELRDRLGRGLRLARPLPATLVFDHPTPEAIAQYLAGAILGLETHAPPGGATAERVDPAGGPAGVGGDASIAPGEPPPPATPVNGLSADEMEALLIEKVERLAQAHGASR
jgi:acyl transferase domain-containing protein/SAM-dependent methyltransferase